jgi:hypothetical protein
MSNAARARANYERYLKYNQSTDFRISDKTSVWVRDKELGFKKGDVERLCACRLLSRCC